MTTHVVEKEIIFLRHFFKHTLMTQRRVLFSTGSKPERVVLFEHVIKYYYNFEHTHDEPVVNFNSTYDQLKTMFDRPEETEFIVLQKGQEKIDVGETDGRVTTFRTEKNKISGIMMHPGGTLKSNIEKLKSEGWQESQYKY